MGWATELASILWVPIFKLTLSIPPFFFPVGDSTWLQHQQVVAQSGNNTLNFDYNWENWSKGGIDKVNLNIGTHKMEANSVAQPMSQT